MSHKDTDTADTEAKTRRQESVSGSQKGKRQHKCLEKVLLFLAYSSVLVKRL